ncbi:MAG: hypothetical protein IPO32_06720 [Crocinitomicaceae bacterium]|jgi:hypothetical protein|nr:hypothetical protein [Crocinitomicaceae bacterium]MBK9591192.1 hypothetical protein [Crocinitomicaceae bacterium]
MLQVDSETILKEIIVEGSFKAIFHGTNNIVELEWDEQLEVIELQTMIQVREAIFVFGNGNKLPVYVSTKPFMNMTNEAKRFASSADGQKYTLASAVLVDNLAKRILYNFYVKFYSSSTPNKAFKSKEEAFIWLNSL